MLDESHRWRKYFVCQKSVFLQRLNRKVECGYRIRVDKWKNQAHDCNQLCLDLWAKPKLTEQENVLQPTSTMDLLFDFIAKHNISIRTAASYELREIQRTMFQMGQQHPTSNFDAMFPKLTRKTVRSGILTYAQEQMKEQVKLFTGVSSLAIDAGKLHNENVLNIMLVNALRNLQPIPFQIIGYFEGTAFAYYKAVRKAVKDLMALDVTIASIVTDNLQAQKKVFENDSTMSIQGMADESLFKALRRGLANVTRFLLVLEILQNKHHLVMI
jgi:hypothetical protein